MEDGENAAYVFSMEAQDASVEWLKRSRALGEIFPTLATAVQTKDTERIGRILTAINTHIVDGLDIRDVLEVQAESQNTQDKWELFVAMQESINLLRQRVKATLQRGNDDREDEEDLRGGPPRNPVPNHPKMPAGGMYMTRVVRRSGEDPRDESDETPEVLPLVRSATENRVA